MRFTLGSNVSQKCEIPPEQEQCQKLDVAVEGPKSKYVSYSSDSGKEK